MKTVRHLVFCLFIAACAFGCQSETVNPASGSKDLLGTYTPVPRPQVQCGASIFTRMKAGNMDLGGVEILNNASDLYVIMDLNNSKYLEEIKVYRGSLSTLPLNDDGLILHSNFPVQTSFSVPLNEYNFTMPLAGLPACNDLVIWARITTRGVLGNVVATHFAWMMGTPVANGCSVNYCATPCSTGGSEGDNVN